MNTYLSKSIDDFRREMESIDKSFHAGEYHNLKRRISFEILDRCLESCVKEHCPQISKDDHYFLIDISVNCYIDERSYFYSIDEIGIDDNDRYLMAKKRIEHVFTCSQRCKLSKDIIEYDVKTLSANEVRNSAVKRKAFWVYLTEINKCHLTDYNIAQDFIRERDKLNLCNNSNSAYTVEELRKFWNDKLYIINGVDLFSYCFLRNRVDQISAEN